MVYAIAAAVFVAAVLFMRFYATRMAAERDTQLQIEKLALIQRAKAESEVLRGQREAEEKSKQVQMRKRVQEEADRLSQNLARRESELISKEADTIKKETTIVERQAAFDVREKDVRANDDRKRTFDGLRKERETEYVQGLEQIVGEERTSIRDRIVAEWVEEAKAEADETVRRADATGPETDREAKRVMGIAVQRFHGHYLTERLLSNLPIEPQVVPRIFGETGENLPIIEEIANIKLTLADDQCAIRLEGQDSFGREIARRAIHRFGKNGVKGGDVRRAVTNIKEELEREVFDLGKRAFKELEIPRAHPDIIKLVGRLNWRTSYTQNQWKHAIEAAFLCGMMAAELGLDEKVARRAALMHDIGKSLTHAIDGSHAVIGADYARRLGETEIVANAIGAHHLDEPFNSSYAYLVAGADAMSGGRPGARREQQDNYAERLGELERIGRSYPKLIKEAFAVHGGREIRIYVKEDCCSDARAVELSGELAGRISEEMTFPGQIKVTVIREHSAVEIAG